jgi:hypothetical protein
LPISSSSKPPPTINAEPKPEIIKKFRERKQGQANFHVPLRNPKVIIGLHDTLPEMIINFPKTTDHSSLIGNLEKFENLDFLKENSKIKFEHILSSRNNEAKHSQSYNGHPINNSNYNQRS